MADTLATLHTLWGDYMTLYEMKKKVLGMIEELNPDSTLLTDDPDIATKINDVINQIMFELARMKKIAKYVEMDVAEGDLVTFEDIEAAVGYVVYQVGTVSGVRYDPKANGTILKMLESGTAEIDCFVYPERIDSKTKDTGYEFELSDDALEIMPYGVAAHLLLSDVSAEYGKIYNEEYERRLQRLDPRYQIGAFTVEGGVNI
jgi:hypothetical protein